MNGTQVNMKFDNNQSNRRLFLIFLVVAVSFLTASILLLGAIRGMNNLVEEQSASLEYANDKLKEQIVKLP